ncbi:MAG: MBL fold metallo-hydrolase [Deltaproteobacteria bacterium]|nr:MBL fold metallo-hydrolase [Deltaproteobacteria bacterium]
MTELKQKHHIDMVFNTHFHFDHIAYNYLFDESRIFINEKEAPCFRDRRAIPPIIGIEEVYGKGWADGWLQRIADPTTEESPYSPQNNHEWWLSTARLDGEYAWGEVLDFGKVQMHVIGAPGHSGGFSCMYFPRYGAIYVADLDLTPFGPWYAGSDGDIDLFISSCRMIENVDAEFFITGHEMGILSKKEFRTGMEGYLAVIEERDKKILSVLSAPFSLEEVVDRGLIYDRKYHMDAWIYMWEFITIKKHLRRLEQQQRISRIGDRFVAV